MMSEKDNLRKFNGNKLLKISKSTVLKFLKNLKVVHKYLMNTKMGTSRSLCN